MRRLAAPACVALLAVFVAVSIVAADTTEATDPNIERLRDESSEVRAAAAKALGDQ